MKKITILTIALFLTTGVFAGGEGFRDRVDNWLKGGGEEESQSLRGCIGETEEHSIESTVPVGEGVFMLSVLAAGYAAVCKKRKNR